MGVEAAYRLSLAGVLAQRLVRTVCDDCRDIPLREACIEPRGRPGGSAGKPVRQGRRVSSVSTRVTVAEPVSMSSCGADAVRELVLTNADASRQEGGS